MKISELIKALEVIKDKEGDLAVVMNTTDMQLTQGLGVISLDYVISAYLDYFDYESKKVIENADVVILE